MNDHPLHPQSETFRKDIQALRGLAILLVVLHHAKLIDVLGAGYLGVDIFFVVSGYLITGIVVKGIRDGTFTFSGFYFRRAKRLLPAAYVTFLATTLLSPLFLSLPEMRDYTRQLLGAVTFTGNIALWLQSGYFESAATLKPLLHVWSLSIEEQYYLLLPAALVFTPRRYWPLGVWAIFAGSLVLCLVMITVRPVATFFLLPTRAWELALGSIGVLTIGTRSVIGSENGRIGWIKWLFWPALVALLVVPLFPTGAPHPGLDALIVGTATLIVILRCHPLLNRSLPVRGLARLGDISYSLYLVHWPLLVFAANAWVSPPPIGVRLGLVVAALVLSVALYRWVERPVRQAEIACRRGTLLVALGASLAVVLAGFVMYWIESRSSLAREVQAHAGDSPPGWGAACEYGDRFAPRPACQNAEAPRILVWGDSYAMHLVEGVRGSSPLGVGVAQATKTTCGPFVGISVFRIDDFYNRRWAEDCLSFNRTVLGYLANTPSVEVVVLSSFTGQYLAGNRLIVGDSPEAITGREGGEEIAFQSLRKTISAVRALGKRVVVVAPPPVANFNVGRCLERNATGKLVFGADTSGCAVSEAS